MTPHVLPGSVKIGPFVYRILRSKDVDMARRWGETDHCRREIRLGELTLGREMGVTFLHELIHAVAQCYEINLKETQTSQLGHGLADALMGLGLWPEVIVLNGEDGGTPAQTPARSDGQPNGGGAAA